MSSLRITEIKLLHLREVRKIGQLEPAWDPGGSMSFHEGGGAIVEIHSDGGLVGIGPGLDPQLLPLCERHLIGKDPFAVEQHWATLNY